MRVCMCGTVEVVKSWLESDREVVTGPHATVKSLDSTWKVSWATLGYEQYPLLWCKRTFPGDPT